MSDLKVSPAEKELRAHVERALAAQYELDQEIGRGGMGIVYRGRDRRLKRTVAIKVLPPELGFRTDIRSRFLKEAELAAQLNHPNIVPIYSVDEQDSLVFFVMACIEGSNIARHLHESGPFDPDEARRILRDVADALAYAHAHGVVHRDIKPDNVIIDADTGRAMVTDFGIARAVTDTDSRLTATGIAIGTPAFMSPEQSVGDKEIDGRSDLYSLGVVGYQMLCGELPFNATNTPSMLMKHISEIPTPIQSRRADVPLDLAHAVMLLLEKEPDNRFPSAEALTQALDTREVPTYERVTRVESDRQRHLPAEQGRRALEEDDAEHQPSDEELRRWWAPSVVAFRRKLAYYIPVNVVIVVFALFTNAEFISLSLVWSMYIAFKYAGLWSDGFDWRDVFRQPRHRTLLDVTSEAIDELGGLSDPERRREIREKARRRRLASGESRRGGSAEPRSPTPPHQAPPVRHSRTGPIDESKLNVVERAALDRNEIVRVVNTMPKKEKARMADVVSSARVLFQRIETLYHLSQAEGRVMPEGAEAIEREIRTLEEQANPLDLERSESRVRRLAYLKRQKRALAAQEDQLRDRASRLEDCSLALHNMRLDVVRLRAGAQSIDNVTLLAERAISLSHDVDGVLAAADELSGQPSSAATRSKKKKKS